jgi:hypothetical protein
VAQALVSEELCASATPLGSRRCASTISGTRPRLAGPDDRPCERPRVPIPAREKKSGEKQCPDMTEKRKGLHLEAPLQRAREDSNL